MSHQSVFKAGEAPVEVTFSQKEIAVFEAIARLLRDGHQPYQLTVAQIAAAAGIGKGTAYEYFKSKEDILQKAIHYHLLQECQQLSQLLSEPGSFKERFFKLLDFSYELFISRAPNLWALAGSMDFAGIIAYKKALSFQRIIQHFESEIDKLMNLGISEACLSNKTTAQYRAFVLSGVTSAYVQGLAHSVVSEDNNQLLLTQKYQTDAWQMLTRALN